MPKIISTLVTLVLAVTLVAEEPPAADNKARAELIEHIRDRILWYDAERTRPYLIPVDVFGLVPLEDLPIPDSPKDSLTGSIALRLRWRSPSGGEYGDCEPPAFGPTSRSVIPEEEKISLETLISEAAVAVVVQIDKTTTVWWHNVGTFQYCEVTVRKFLHGENFNAHTKKIKGFLAPGGEFMLNGARICTIDLWHTRFPEIGDTYLVLGAPDEAGIFDPRAYFQVVDGLIEWVPYSSIRRPQSPISVELFQ